MRTNELHLPLYDHIRNFCSWIPACALPTIVLVALAPGLHEVLHIGRQDAEHL